MIEINNQWLDHWAETEREGTVPSPLVAAAYCLLRLVASHNVGTVGSASSSCFRIRGIPDIS